jgi:putative ABC transport system permease protein
MTYKDLFEETTSALLANKVRTGLTILGIVIGIASVIAMVAIGNGSTESIQSSIQSIGSNLIEISPGAQRTPGSTVSAGRGTANTLTMSDVTALENQMTSAAAIAPDVTEREQVVAGALNTNTSIVGTVSAYTSVRDITIDVGTFFTDQQVTNLARVAVLGPTAYDDLFGTTDNPTPDTSAAIGQTIRIKGNIFTVIGVTVAKGGSGLSSVDDNIYIPLTVAQQFFSGNQYVSEISIEAQTSDLVTEAQNEATSILLTQHNITDPTKADFSILNQSDILSTASSITTTLTYLLAAIAGISLLVGGIGIMNMMLTTVTERTKEIGLRKAIGAKKRDIRMQFLVESIILTSVGGIIGIGLGIFIAWVVSVTGLEKAEITLWPVILSFGVSACIGIAFGYYPASRASELNPIEALRYE